MAGVRKGKKKQGISLKCPVFLLETQVTHIYTHLNLLLTTHSYGKHLQGLGYATKHNPIEKI